ncbi:hydroxyethylthiazole kinase [Friedmanniella endophytica]|uniref:Hydroxyethylthiazole kinase n=1 Tax=Microlunatus kandeliicorticis TaxID=1759536 RepID=A0A7W3P6B6_9ACTN|nr:hydroxyethylthiazole kinase [Microlunatus kandeliicorticis]MBA8794787.1 hydroxyethylthiazole kinase [Microlunatus kandeliicorticis]
MSAFDLPARAADSDLSEAVADARASVFGTAPLVQCLTNTVVTTITANVLLAAGAAPAMVDNAHEAAEFARVAAAVLINLGTPDDQRAEAMRAAAASATTAGTRWVLDPVAVGGLSFRTALARDLLDQRPTLIRGNASEVIALAGMGEGGRGVDTTVDPEAAEPAARALSSRTGGVVAVSGPTDVIVAGDRTLRLGGGSEMLTRTTGAGCALGALCAAYLGATADPLAGTLAAHLHVALAAEEAEIRTAGPGSFVVAWVDAISATGPDELAAGLLDRLA